MNSKPRWYKKANAYADAWQKVLGVSPPHNAVVLGLSVAQHETLCGDAWPGENNWGAVQLRSLNDIEDAALDGKGLKPHPNNVKAAREVFAEEGLDEPFGGLHVDYSPRKGRYYWVWFSKFATEAEGAIRCVQVLAKRRTSCRAILERSTGNEAQLAEAMYATGYYEGIHEPHSLYRLDDNGKKWIKIKEGERYDGEKRIGADLNVQDYTRALSRWAPQVRIALSSWAHGANIPMDQIGMPGAFDFSTVLGRQQALNFIGSDPRLVEDGIPGPKTKASVAFFQKAAGLTSQDGEWSTVTLDMMIVVLGMVPNAPRVLAVGP